MIHTYEILAGTSKASILRFMDDLSTYNEVETSLKDLSSFLVEKNERYYDDNDEGKEFLIGPSTETEVLWNNNKEFFFQSEAIKVRCYSIGETFPCSQQLETK